MSWLVNEREFEQLTLNHQILESTHGVAKVFKTSDLRIIKLFANRRHPSSQWLYPCSFRFRRNALRLRQLGFQTPEVSRVFYRQQSRQHGVEYPMLPGTNLEGCQTDAELVKRLAIFVAKLHARGVLFRALHLGNIIDMPNARFGLIDVDNTQFFVGPLSPSQRARNFRHLFRPARLGDAFTDDDINEFVQIYIHATQQLDESYQNLANSITCAIPQLRRET